MRIDYPKSVLVTLVLLNAGNLPAQETDLDDLRKEVVELRSEYESRINELEQRLAVAEQNARQANVAAQQAAAAEDAPAPTGSPGNAFNPAIGVIFQGTAWNHGADPEGYAVPGLPFGGEAGPIDEGLALGETEIDVSANVDDKFTAFLTLPVVIEDGEPGVEIEEAWIETMALPAGFSARMGRFFSGIGYLNGKHAHSWDFADQPLPYQALLGDQYLDDGLQFRWIAPTALYTEIGTELLRGGRYPSAGARHSGIGAHSIFVNLGGDVGASSSWLAGLSWLDSNALDRHSGDEDGPFLFSGDSTMLGAHAVWKWAPNGNWRQRNLILQAEYLLRSEDGDYTLPDGREAAYDADHSGWYLQAVYQPVPLWRIGARIDGLSADDPGPALANSLLAPRDDNPRRYTLMGDWSPSEFSRLRFQYTRDEAGIAHAHEFGLQYIHSIGAHGAHTF